MKELTPHHMDKIISLCKRRGFIFPGSEIYGGLANSWDYGPLGVELKNKIKQLWWKRFVTEREDMVGLDSSLLLNTKVWEASGHLATFSDSLVVCKKCNNRYRVDELVEQSTLNEFKIHFIRRLEKIIEDAKNDRVNIKNQSVAISELNKLFDNTKNKEKKESIYQIAQDMIQEGKNHISSTKSKLNLAERIYNTLIQANKYYGTLIDVILEKISCPKCVNTDWTESQQFNLMMKTHLGPVEDEANAVYFRPETAQGIFINFKNILDTTRKKLPFGVGQIGKAFRNEITPGNFIFRTREFEQMEIEYFIPTPEKETDWQTYFEDWRQAMVNWITELGIDYKTEIHELDVPADELAHYSKKTIDFEYEFPFGKKELYGLAYRTDFDLKNHGLTYTDENGETYTPHVIEPSLGVERTVLAVLLSAYTEEQNGDETRVVLRLPKKLAPITVAIFPLLKNKEALVSKAREIYTQLKKSFACDFDDNGNVGKRYRRQDEIGTPFCITVDFDSLEQDDVTVRERDSMKQTRVKISELEKFLADSLK